MDFNFSKQQQMIKTEARAFLKKKCPPDLVVELMEDNKGYSVELWREMAELGFLGLLIPEAYGGMDGEFMELGLLMEEIGRVSLLSPFFTSSVCSTLALINGGNEEQKQELLPEIADGNSIVTLAIDETPGGFDPSAITLTANKIGSDYVISGSKLPVSYAHISDYILCAARTGQHDKKITLFLVNADSPGVVHTPVDSITGEKQFLVNFQNVIVSDKDIVGDLDHGGDILLNILPKMTVAKCFEMIGGAQKAFDLSVEYAKKRVQFGKPIGAFQAIQHHCANMITYVDHSRFLIYKAAWMLNEGFPCPKEVSASKAFVGEACRKVIFLAHQIHGALAFQQEHEMHLYFKRAKESEEMFGDADYHLDIVANELGL